MADPDQAEQLRQRMEALAQASRHRSALYSTAYA